MWTLRSLYGKIWIRSKRTATLSLLVLWNYQDRFQSETLWRGDERTSRQNVERKSFSPRHRANFRFWLPHHLQLCEQKVTRLNSFYQKYQQKLLSLLEVDKIIIDEVYTFYHHLYRYDSQGKKTKKTKSKLFV